MLGLGETSEEVLQVMRDLQAHHVDILTLGQYLRPSTKHLPIIRYIPAGRVRRIQASGLKMGFAHVEAGPLVRSSYHADGAEEAALQVRLPHRLNHSVRGAVIGALQGIEVLPGRA